MTKSIKQNGNVELKKGAVQRVRTKGAAAG